MRKKLFMIMMIGTMIAVTGCSNKEKEQVEVSTTAEDTNTETEDVDLPEDSAEEDETEEEIVNNGEKDIREIFECFEREDGYYIGEYIGDEGGVVEIPSTIDGIKVVGLTDKAFVFKEGVTEVILPEGIIEIEAAAFLGCKDLVKVNIPDSVTIMEDNVFNSCGSLKEVTGFKGLTELPQALFYLVGIESFEVPDNITSIATECFSSCEKLREVIIPESVTSIDKYAFENSENVTIVGKAGSYAETFAKENGIPFEAK